MPWSNVRKRENTIEIIDTISNTVDMIVAKSHIESQIMIKVYQGYQRKDKTSIAGRDLCKRKIKHVAWEKNTNPGLAIITSICTCHIPKDLSTWNVVGNVAKKIAKSIRVIWISDSSAKVCTVATGNKIEDCFGKLVILDIGWGFWMMFR